MVKVKIERYSNQLEGIGHVDGKVIFVPKTKIGDIVNVKITEEKSKYYRGVITDVNKNVDCPYFYECGGCHLRHLDYDMTLLLKKNNFKDLLLKNNLYIKDIKVFENNNSFNYRNKVSLKIVDKKIGYYQEKTNNIVEIDNCLIIKDVINDFISEISKFKINNGSIMIRTNYNDELLISITTDDQINFDFESLKENFKIAGVVINKNAVLNDDFIIDKIGDTLFKISYDSFFQVNNYGASKIVEVIKNNIDESDEVLDLYCGVGTIGLSIAKNVKKVLGVEIVPNAIRNALENVKMNNITNAEFVLGDVSKVVDKIKNKFNTIIVDPPRAGLDENTKRFITENSPEKIIYVSCNPITLVRDLNDLSEMYKVEDVSIVDMFSYTYHCESVCVLERKSK